MKYAGSLLGFKHNDQTKEFISKTNKNAIRSSDLRLRIATTLSKGVIIFVKNSETGETKSFVSIRQASEFIQIQFSYLAKQLNKNKFYLGRGFFVYSSSENLEDIFKSEAYISAIAKINKKASLKKFSEYKK